MQKVVIIGGGVGGLAAACLLGKAGYGVTVLEKEAQLGGRNGRFTARGFAFDTGPSWYLIPDVYEHFFGLMGEHLDQHLKLVKLSPHYRVFYKGTGQHLDITGGLQRDKATFEAIEAGAGAKLEQFLSRAAKTYQAAYKRFLYKNYDRASDLFTPETLRTSLRLPLFSSLHRYVQRDFSDHRLQKILEYPAVFLGTSPYKAPALYSLMNHVDFAQGVYYPKGGMYQLVKALVRIGKKYGVTYHTAATVEKITSTKDNVTGVMIDGRQLKADIVISDAGVAYTETKLLPPDKRDHRHGYWQSRTKAPGALLLYLGVDRSYASLKHHNLLFSADWRQNFKQLTGWPGFPTSPSLYVCAPSKTDPSVAPKGCENLFVLVPIHPGFRPDKKQLSTFVDSILATLEAELKLADLRGHLLYKRAVITESLGLAHTLRQTAAFRPSNKSKKLHGLYYTGADVHPGVGLPPALISAELVYKHLIGDASATPLPMQQA